MSTQLADSHLTYIGSDGRFGFSSTVYDVYRREGGHQLGWVMTANGGKTWRAISDDPTVDDMVGRTRWEAATALWGDAAAFDEVQGEQR